MSGEKDIPENKETLPPAAGNENILPKQDISSPETDIPASQTKQSTMEVHKHPHHVTHKKKWSEYLLEFLMIFLAVFLGFIAENLREHNVEKGRAKQYAKSLISDLKNDTAMVNDHIHQITGNMTRIDSLSAYVYSKKINQISNFELAHKSSFWFYNPYTWSRATVDQIKSSGSLRYFDNDSIVYKISAYDAFTRHLDYDYLVDQNQKDKTIIKREQIIDMNYPGQHFIMLVDARYDSLKNTAYFEEMRKLNKPLLTKDLNEINVLVNQSLQLRSLLRVRRDFELPRLVKNATELIHLLEKQYHLN